MPDAEIFVLAGTNGAGKSSIGGALFTRRNASYFNPDEAARQIMVANPGMSVEEANSAAWHEGRRLLEQAIEHRLAFAFETTLGGKTIPRLLAEAAGKGIAVRVWYAGLANADLHVARVRERVARGGHDIPEITIRERYVTSILNLTELTPHLAELYVYDNTAASPTGDAARARPTLLLHTVGGKIIEPADLSRTPEWAKPILAAAMMTAESRSD